MRIVAVRREPVACILSVIYAVFGLYAFLLFAFTNAQTLTLPLGFVATVIHFNINFNLPRPTGLALGALYLALTILLYCIDWMDHGRYWRTVLQLDSEMDGRNRREVRRDH